MVRSLAIGFIKFPRRMGLMLVGGVLVLSSLTVGSPVKGKKIPPPHPSHL